MVIPMASPDVLSLTDLQLQDDRTTSRIIAVLRDDPNFHALSIMEGQALIDRDHLDNEKLRQGICYAVANGTLPPKGTTAAPQRIQVIGKTSDEICATILKAVDIHGEDTRGKIITLQGLSGTGKGTTAKKIAARLPQTITWSNGNVFRCLTVCLLRDAAGLGPNDSLESLSEADLPAAQINPLSISKCMQYLKFDFCPDRDGAHCDIHIDIPEGPSLHVCAIQNTILKYPSVARFVPLVAEKSQGEVIQFTLAAIRTITATHGWNVLIEGRNETLNYIDTPHRFELVLGTPEMTEESAVLLLGQRRAAQRVAGEFLRAQRSNASANVEKTEIVRAMKGLLS